MNARVDGTPDVDALLASLLAEGARRFDPVRWHYIEVLAKRAAEHQGSVRRLLDDRLAQVLASFKERFDLARVEAREILDRGAQHYPHAASELQRHFAAGDFKALQAVVATLQADEQHASLRALVRQLEQHAADSAQAAIAPRPELKTIRNFRNTWAKLSVDKQVAQALGQAPKNAGPINSHALVLRSLALMRDIAPDYLSHFMSYADTLLCLDQSERDKPAPPKKTPALKPAKK